MATTRQALREAGPISRLDAEVLLSHALGKDRTFLHTHPENELTKRQLRIFRKFVSRRQRHEPVAYITGQKEFFGRNFLVGPSVLIPRPLTEHLVELALGEKARAYADVGTGSGCIAITLALETPAKIIATDTSSRAMRMARKNARLHGVRERISFKKTSSLPQEEGMVVVANLPYVPQEDYQGLAPEITLWEPRRALVAPEQGLYFYRLLLEQSGPKTVLFLEILPKQKQGLLALAKKLFPDAAVSFYFSDHVARAELR